MHRLLLQHCFLPLQCLLRERCTWTTWHEHATFALLGLRLSKRILKSKNAKFETHVFDRVFGIAQSQPSPTCFWQVDKKLGRDWFATCPSMDPSGTSYKTYSRMEWTRLQAAALRLPCNPHNLRVILEVRDAAASIPSASQLQSPRNCQLSWTTNSARYHDSVICSFSQML